MRITSLTISIAASLLLLGFAGQADAARAGDPVPGIGIKAASAQVVEEERPVAQSIAIGRVTLESPAIALSKVGKQVAPGVIQVDPGSISGKRLFIDPQSMRGNVGICIGVYSKKRGACYGIWIDIPIPIPG